MSNYEEELERIFGKVGKSEAYKIIQEKIYSAIAENYPELKEECESQLSKKSGCIEADELDAMGRVAI